MLALEVLSKLPDNVLHGTQDTLAAGMLLLAIILVLILYRYTGKDYYYYPEYLGYWYATNGCHISVTTTAMHTKIKDKILVLMSFVKDYY